MPGTVKRLMMVFAILCLAALPALAKPNFSGDWKLNASKSDFGQFPAPSGMTQKVKHEEPSLKVDAKIQTEGGDFDISSSYTTDGKECSNQFGPNTMKSVLKWDGNTLIIDTKGTFGDAEMTMQDKWDLSEDGQTMTIRRHWASSMGEMDQKIVMEKQ